MANYDAGLFDLTITSPTKGALAVAECTGGDLDPMQEVTPNDGPGGRRFGVNLQRSANGADLTLTIRETSIQLGDVLDIARLQEEVGVQFEARDKSIFSDGQIVGFTCTRAWLMSDAVPLGKGDAEDVSITGVVAGYSWLRKNAAPIVVT